MRLYLASRSPRRRELLHQIGIDFDTVVFRDGMRADLETDETPLVNEDPVLYVERIARAKALHGLKIVEERRLPMRPVLAAGPRRLAMIALASRTTSSARKRSRGAEGSTSASTGSASASRC